MIPRIAFVCLAFFATANLVQSAEPPKAEGRQTRTVEGWSVLISDKLLEKDKADTERALELLTAQLQEIARVVPAAAVVELRKVPLWFSPEYPGVRPTAEYHPEAGWLRENKRDPAMAQAVEFTDIRTFEQETKRMPNFALHELAHAYHDRFLPKGFENEEIKDAYERAKAKGLYDRVEQRFGDGRSADVRAYAMTNPMEYFAECSEAFFSTNDFFPFNREQLARHDPEMFELLNKLWSSAADLSPQEKFDTDPKHQLPRPDAKAADMSKPVKVFILMGQSNMVGMGDIGPETTKGTLAYLTKAEKRYPHLLDDAGNWTTRSDVRHVFVMHNRGSMQTVKNDWLTVQGGTIGPELQFGHIMGHVLDEPVLVLKACIGNRSLGWDLLPPGSERFTLAGTTYAGYQDDTPSWVEGQEKKPVAWYAGKQYDDDVANAKKVLNELGKYYPGAEKYEVAGFVWWQGHKDQNPAHASRYEQNLVRLIKTLREDFHAPQAPFVLATIGFDGWNLAGPGLTIANAQLAVGDPAKHPEFAGNVKCVEARNFWRAVEVSPKNQGYHYNRNAETYMEVGNALGWAMTELLKN